MKIKLKKGFTLIELMVVIAIIGLLSAIVFANLVTSRNKAQNVVRLQDVRNYINVFEWYLNDNNTYPYPQNLNTAHCVGIYRLGYCNWFGVIPQDNIVNSLISNYIPTLPGDNNLVDASPGPSLFGYEYICTNGDSINFKCYQYTLEWIMAGNSGCGLGTVFFASSQFTRCQYTSPLIK
jgi:prepilin-type N-terminal cleavage/methylation domain-containing protein